MPYSVRCKACSSSFAIPDEIWDKRVKGRIATLKCRSCKAEIHVDGTKEGVVQLSVAPPAAPVSSPAATASPTPEPAAAPTAAAALRVAAPNNPAISEAASVSATTTSPGIAASLAIGTAASPLPPRAGAGGFSNKPSAKAAQEIAAADAGWSLMPPPGDLERVGLSPKPAPAAATPKLTEPTPAAPTPAPAPVANAAPTASVPPISISPDSAEDLPPDPHLWVVSYGEDDDRELTEKQIATELIKGHITLSTIVWQEGMDEWLPISGVKILAKYAPTQRPAPIRLAKSAATGKAGAQPARAATAPTTGKADSTGPRPAAQPREKQPSSPVVDPKLSPKGKDPEPKTATKAIAAAQAQGPQPAASEGRSAKGPPPLTKSGDSKTLETKRHAATTTVSSKVPANKVAMAASGSSGAGQQGGKPPPLGRRPLTADTASPWTQEDAGEEVLTSAPDVGAAIQAKTAISATGNAAPAAAEQSTPSQRSAAKASIRPPKPVETATSLVRRTEGASGQDLLITDDDFLAMQQRYPKWALPAGIAGGVALIGLIVVALNSGDQPPTLPSTPAADTNAVLRENPAANQVQPRHRQPDLNAIPTGLGVASDEKDFAKLFAQSALKTSGTFDVKAAEQATKNVMELAARCRVAPDPSGQARVVITFSTAGQVLSVQIGSPYANTITGKCIEKALRQIRTRAFQGEPGRLPLTVPIH